MRKIFALFFLLILSMPLTACRNNTASDGRSQVVESKLRETGADVNKIQSPSPAGNTVSQNSVTENKYGGSKSTDSKPGVNNPNQTPNGTTQEAKTSTPSSKKNDTAADSNESSVPHEEEPAKDIRIRLTFNDVEIIVKMYDNPASQDFVNKLPLALTFKDYAGTEKISYLPQKLSTADSPSGYDPSDGELAYYAPWGNICFFYHDFGYSTGLVPLGIIESGRKSLTSLDGDFTVKIEKY